MGQKYQEAIKLASQMLPYAFFDDMENTLVKNPDQRSGLNSASSRT